jgi:hypothetical protein
MGHAQKRALQGTNEISGLGLRHPPPSALHASPVSGPMRRDLRRVPRSKLDPRRFIGGFASLVWRYALMVTLTSGAVPVARSEPRTRIALLLLLEAIALRHQIAVLERSRLDVRTSVVLIGCFGSCCRAGGRNGATACWIVQPETVLRCAVAAG